MIYYVDIDNTICKTHDSNYKNSVPYINRIDRMNDLYRQGNEVHYWTARGGSTGKDWSEFTIEQFAKWGVLYTSLNFKKPSYDIWIDDKGLSDKEFFNDINNR